MKILHLIYNLSFGGTEKVMLETLPKLRNFGHLICVIKSANPKIAEEFQKENIPVIKLSGLKIFHFRKIIKKEKPDLICTYLIYADIFGRIFGKLFGVKKISTSIRSTYNEPKYKFWLFLEKITSGLVNKYIAVSQAVKNIYCEKLGIPTEKIEVIYNGVKIEKYNIEINKNLKKEELGLPRNSLIIGNIGKLRPEKGQIYLIQAMPEIIKKFPQTILLLVGGGENKQKLENLAERLRIRQHLKLLEESQDIPEILKTFDVFVNPSLYEGLSNTILEAMAAKIPIVASDIFENQELIENKKTGFLVPVGNNEKNAEAVIEILENPDFGRKMAEAAFEKIQNFSIEKTLEKLNNFLYALLYSKSE